jgi:hypothetical protein
VGEIDARCPLDQREYLPKFHFSIRQSFAGCLLRGRNEVRVTTNTG